MSSLSARPIAKISNLAGTGCVLVISLGLLFFPAPGSERILDCISDLKKTFETASFGLVAPLLKAAIRYEVPTQNSAKCSDKQSVNMDVTIRYFPMPKNMAELCDQTSPDYRKITIIPTVHTIISKIISSYSAARLYSSSHESLQDKIAMQLDRELSKFDIGLEEVTIRHINFTGTYASEIKRKQLALQKAEHLKKETDQFNSTQIDYQTANQPAGTEYTRNHWLLGGINHMWDTGARASSPRCCSSK